MDKFCNVWNKVPDAYKGVVLFVICLLCSDLLWELTIEGDESDFGAVSFCGKDISWMFYSAKLWFAEKTHIGLSAIGVYSQLIIDNIEYSNGHGCRIIAGCTGVKQFYMMTVILLFSRGRMTHKSWYWFASMIVLLSYNVVRLMILTYIVRDHQELFELMHVHVMKYIFYGLMFLLWLLWDEWLRKVLTKREAD